MKEYYSHQEVQDLVDKYDKLLGEAFDEKHEAEDAAEEWHKNIKKR